MRIGILTFHNAINYGAVIQCYALTKFMEQRGHTVEVIDYRLHAIEDYKVFFSFHTLCSLKGIKKKIIYILNSVLLRKRKKKVIRAFNTFLSTRLPLSYRYSDGQNISQYYDYVIFGSDQIWNLKLTNGFDPVFWGQIEKGNSIFATYAASMGEIDILSNSQWEIVADKLKAFDYISVRELSLKNCLNNKFGMNVDYCVDPTLLVDSKTLDVVAVKPQEDNYVYLYNVTKDKHAEVFASNIASLLGCKVIMTNPKPRIKRSKNCCEAEAISPEEFLGYIKYAKMVIGNSFHAVILSIIFRKDFYSLNSHRPERIKGVLKDLGLIERHVNSTDNVHRVSFVDYSQVEQKINHMRESSLLYIDKIGL